MTPPVVVGPEVVGTPGVVVCDVRWYPDGREGASAHRAGHLPGAVYVDLAADLAGSAGLDPPTGQYPLPSPGAFASMLSRLGIGDEVTVVAYDDVGGMAAARLVWMLRAIGRPASLLDGGLQAWPGPPETGSVSPAPVACSARPWPDARLADLDLVAEHGTRGCVLLDAGTPARYRGESNSIHDRAGHIPGARNVTWTGDLDPNTGRFLPPDMIRRRYEVAGVVRAEDAVLYCGAGVAACHALLALEHAGLGHGRLYPGSWSQWSADPARPVARARDLGM